MKTLKKILRVLFVILPPSFAYMERIAGWISGATSGDVSDAFANIAEFWNRIPDAAFPIVVVIWLGVIAYWLSAPFHQRIARFAKERWAQSQPAVVAHPASVGSPPLQAIPIASANRLEAYRMQLREAIDQCPTTARSRDKADHWRTPAIAMLKKWRGSSVADSFAAECNYANNEKPKDVQRVLKAGKAWLESESAIVSESDLQTVESGNRPVTSPQSEAGGKVFEVRPIHANSNLFPSEHHHEIIAKLAIRNVSGKIQSKCSVRLMDAFLLMNGGLWDMTGAHPSIHHQRGESFYLRWSVSESSTPDRKYLDIPSDKAERLLDCLILDQERNNGADFCAANPADLEGIKLQGVGGPKWWKLRVVISSENGASEECELLAACGSDPGPITLAHWSPRGELILQEQRREIEEGKKRRKEEDRKAAAVVEAATALAKPDSKPQV